MLQFSVNNSSLISKIEYDDEKEFLTVHFIKYYVSQLSYSKVDFNTFHQFIKSKSVGKFYLRFIKNKKQVVMADKIIKIKLDVSKIKKDWLFVGEKGVYLDITLLYNEKQDKYECNGMAIQDVPSKMYKEDNTLKGIILGNAKEFNRNPVPKEAIPGTENGNPGISGSIDDDLPF